MARHKPRPKTAAAFPRPQLRSDELWLAHSRGAAGWATRKSRLFRGITDRNFPDEPKFRIARGLTANQLSSALSKSSPLTSEELAQIELGTRMIYDHQILAISQVLGVRISELFGTPPRKRRPKREPK